MRRRSSYLLQRSICLPNGKAGGWVGRNVGVTYRTQINLHHLRDNPLPTHRAAFAHLRKAEERRQPRRSGRRNA